MVKSEEKSHHQQPLSLPKSKGGAQNDMEDVEKEDEVVGEQSEEDLEDEDLEVDLRNALWSTFARLLAR